MTGNQLMKIATASYGFGGYQGEQFGLSLEFTSPGTGVGFFDGHWADRSEFAKWSVEDQEQAFVATAKLVRDTLRKAKKRDVAALVGTPVEVTFEGNLLKSWRVLEEVL